MKKLTIYRDMPQPPFRFLDGIDEIEIRSFEDDMRNLGLGKGVPREEPRDHVTTLRVVRKRQSGRKKDDKKRVLIEEAVLAGKSRKQTQTFVKNKLAIDESPSPKLISAVKKGLKAEGRL